MSNLYRTEDGLLLVKHGQAYFDECNNAFYTDINGTPVDNNGKPIQGKVVEKMFYDTPEDYMRDFPTADNPAFWWHKTGKTFLLQTYSYYRSIEGNFLLIWVEPEYVYPNAIIPKTVKPFVLVNDGDDAYMRRYFDTNEQALTAGEELKALAPFHMDELKHFGYEVD